MLLKEQRIAKERLLKLEDAAEKPVTFERFDASYHRVSQRHDYPGSSINKQVPMLNGKTLSYGLLLNVIGRRFHECLHAESQAKPN